MNQDGNIKSLALRHDVDCCIWNTEEMNPKCPMNHIATFDGVGYIHGKTVNFGMGLKLLFQPVKTLSHSQSHLRIINIWRWWMHHDVQWYIGKHQVIIRMVSDYNFYRKNCPLNSSLRNRSTGAKMDDIGRQQMVNIQCQDRFIGATCTNNHLYLITKAWFKAPIGCRKYDFKSMVPSMTLLKLTSGP